METYCKTINILLGTKHVDKPTHFWTEKAAMRTSQTVECTNEIWGFLVFCAWEQRLRDHESDCWRHKLYTEYCCSVFRRSVRFGPLHICCFPVFFFFFLTFKNFALCTDIRHTLVLTTDLWKMFALCAIARPREFSMIHFLYMCT